MPVALTISEEPEQWLAVPSEEALELQHSLAAEGTKIITTIERKGEAAQPTEARFLSQDQQNQ